MTQIAVKERGIPFSTDMVKAIIEGKKTQTRRVIKASNSTVLGYAVSKNNLHWMGLVWDDRVYKDKGPHILHPSTSEYLHVPWVDPDDTADDRVFRVRSRYEIGDRLWVRETWKNLGNNEVSEPRPIYKADYLLNSNQFKWKSPRFMPRWASRINLEITDIRVERLQDITEEDAEAEGFFSHIDEFQPGASYLVKGRDCFYRYWDSLNAKHPWEDNPWVWVIGFKEL